MSKLYSRNISPLFSSCYIVILKIFVQELEKETSEGNIQRNCDFDEALEKFLSENHNLFPLLTQIFPDEWGKYYRIQIT